MKLHAAMRRRAQRQDECAQSVDCRPQTVSRHREGDAVAYCVLPDHPVPIRLGKHTRTPVPVAVYQPGATADDVRTYDEIACPKGRLGHLAGGGLMDVLLGGSRIAQSVYTPRGERLLLHSALR